MRMLNYFATTTPEAEPITLEEAKLHLRVVSWSENEEDEDHPDDALISSLITVAREHAEKFTGRALARCTYTAIADNLPSGDEALELPLTPVISLQSLSYTYGGETVEMPLSDLELVADDSPAVILPADSWPSITAKPGAVRVVFEAGYLTGSDAGPIMPTPIKQAMLLLIGHLYEHRAGAVERSLSLVPLGVESLLRRYRVQTGFA